MNNYFQFGNKQFMYVSELSCNSRRKACILLYNDDPIPIKLLKKDGSFNWSNSAFDSGTGTITFNGKDYEFIDLASIEVNEDNITYRIDNNTVSEEEMDEFAHMQDEKEDVYWYSLIEENISSQLQVD